LVGLVKKIWSEESIRQIVADGTGVPDSIEYLISRMDEMLKDDYSPSNQDILCCRIKTTGVYETTFNIANAPFRIVDVGGQRSERRKWVHFFEDVTALIFCASLSGYYQVLEEDETTNRMHEALELFKGIAETKYFRNSAIILFLNKKDIFEKKIKEKNITCCFPEYSGEQSYEPAIQYISSQFTSKAPAKKIYIHATCATDTQNVRIIWNTIKKIFLEEVINF